MATIEARGYINRFEKKVSAGGKEFSKFTLSVQQKRKDKSGQMVTEKVYFTCVDFSGKEPPGLHMSDRNELTAYVGLKGYLTVTNWVKDGKGGANLDVTVTEYQEQEQRAPAAVAAPARVADDAPPSDPFAIKKDKP